MRPYSPGPGGPPRRVAARVRWLLATAVAALLLPVGLSVTAQSGSDHVTQAAGPCPAFNTLVRNGNFEEVHPAADYPVGWSYTSFVPGASLAVEEGQAYSGRKSVRITAPAENDAAWTQDVTVYPNTTYVLSGRIKTQGVLGGAGANLSLVGTWTHTAGVFGTTDWTYVSLTFNSGSSIRARVGGRLGYWAGTSSGTAWFDDVQLTPIVAGGPTPPWKILVLIYGRTDFTYTDADGVPHRMVAAMTEDEKYRAAQAATQFVEADIPALTSGVMVPTVTVRFPQRALTQLDPFGGGWSPSPANTAPERDPAFDSVIVIWDPRAVDQTTGQPRWIGAAAGLAYWTGANQTYLAMIVDAAHTYGHRNVFKHEWGHSILFYFDAAGTAPQPAVTNHAEVNQYVHWPTGENYVWVDETEANPIPNSIYNNESGFTHDYYSGSVATADQPTRRLGITPEAWALGGPVSKPALRSPQPDPDDVVLYATDASVIVGNWFAVDDTTAAGRARLWNPDRGAPKITPASPDPADYFEMTFKAAAGTPYHLWVRGTAQDHSTLNDAVYVQFSDTVDRLGRPAHRIGTTGSVSVILEDCDRAGVLGWGWADNGWCGPGAYLYFAESGEHTLRVQVRQDGFSIDQIVLSSRRFLDTSAGAPKVDCTVLPRFDGLATLFADRFDSRVIDPARWLTAVLSGYQDRSVPVRQGEGRLEIGPLVGNAAGSHYNGVISTRAFDLTGAYAYVQAVKTPASSTHANMMFTLVADHLNHYRIYVSAGELKFESKVGGAKSLRMSRPFDPAGDAYWRIRHDRAFDMVAFETAPDDGGQPGVWRTHDGVPRALPITSLSVELKAGTWQPEASSPGVAVFDNVRVVKQ